MSKYIDADAVIPQIYKDLNGCYNAGFKGSFRQSQIEEALEHIPAADVEPVRKWIPCTERLPEDLKFVLICYESGAIDIAWRNRGDWWVEFSADGKRSGAVAWMPLPEPPKENDRTNRNYDRNNG